MKAIRMFEIFMSSGAAFTPERWDEYISVAKDDKELGDISDTRDIIKKKWGTWTEEEKIRFDYVWIYIFQKYVDK
jgi:hypothetical protein